MADALQCPHCGVVFDPPTFEGHVINVARTAPRRQVAEWLLQWAMERESQPYRP